MFDHTVNDALRLTGEPDLANASLTFTALDGSGHVTVNARMTDDDDLDALTRFLTGLTDDPEEAARRFLHAWGRGYAREAVKTLTGVCTVRLDLRIDLTGQTDQWPEILVQSTITDEDVRDHLADRDCTPPVGEDSPVYERALEGLREYDDGDAKIAHENDVIDACAGI